MIFNQSNIGKPDQALRAVVGMLTLYAGFITQHGLLGNFFGLVLGILGLSLLTTALLKVCPLYAMAGFSTTARTNSKNTEEKTFKKIEFKTESVNALKRKLQVSVVLPMVVLLLLMSVFIFDFNHKLDLARVLQQEELASTIAERYLLDTSEVSEQDKSTVRDIINDSIKDTQTYFYHDKSGTHLPVSFEKGIGEKPFLEFRNTIDSLDLSSSSPTRGMLMTDKGMYVYTAIPVASTGNWFTAIKSSPNSHNMLGIFFSTKFIVSVLLVLSMGLWSSTFVIRKFISKMRENADLLQHRATHDPLTGLPNRQLIEPIFNESLKNFDPESENIAFLMVDMIGFRDINDTLGQLLGDELLIEVSGLLQKIQPDKIDVVRMGADVFCLVCILGHDRTDASRVSNLIHDALEISHELDGVPVVVQVRIGIAFYQLDAIDAHQLTRYADIALAQAKKTRIADCFYHHEHDTHSVRKLSLLARLRAAIEHNELSLVYQPKLDLKTNNIVGVEVLVRWHDAEYGFISPVEFVHWAEKSGLIDNLTRWVLLAAAEQNRLWHTAGCELPFAINLSPTNLYDHNLVPIVKDMLENGSFKPGFLELELTENAVMEDPEKALETMQQLDALGVGFAIDDFGTGLSSFTYLRQFPVTNLKIDRAFIKDLDASDRDAVLLRSMINLGHDIGCIVTAEGVEEESSLINLREFDCDSIQGYYISKPLSADQFLQWYQSGCWLPDKAA